MSKATKQKARRNKPVVLPRIPSKLIEIALEDLRRCEKAKETYTVDMGIAYHSPYWGTKCSVCAAGAIMAQRLGAEPSRHLRPLHFGPNKEQLEAVNYLRLGLAEGAIRMLGVTAKRKIKDAYVVANYEEDPARFKQDLRRLAKILKEAGV